AEVLYRAKNATRSRLAKMSAKPESGALLNASFLKRNGLLDPDVVAEIHDSFRDRDIFWWQVFARETLQILYDDHYPENKSRLLSTAQDILDHRLRIFDKPVSFPGRVDWHLDPLENKTVPLQYWSEIDYKNPKVVQDVKYIWELNRHQHFVTLAKAFYLTGEENYAKELFSQWRDWLDKNPYLFGVSWTSALELAFRLISWSRALQFSKSSEFFTPELLLSILQSVEQHARFIAQHLSRYSSGNNHLIGEAVGLIYAGCCFPGLRDREKWRRKGFSIVFQQLPAQTFPDGVIKEQAVHYLRYLFDFGILARTAAAQENMPVPQEFDETLEKMAGFVYALYRGQRLVPKIGDEDGGQAIRWCEKESDPYASILATAGYLFNRPEFFGEIDRIDEATFWRLGVAEKPNGMTIKERTSQTEVSHFPHGGYIVIRHSAKNLEQQVVFDCGPLGFGALAAHGHADALHFTLAVNGQAVLIDSGTYRYQCQPKWRSYFRGTRAHNTVTVDDLDQSQPLASFQWGRKAKAVLEKFDQQGDRILLVGRHDGYAKKGVVHRRQMLFEPPGQWTITDFVEGKGVHRISLNFHLSPCRYEIEGSNAVTAVFERCRLVFLFSSDKEFVMDIVQGQEEPFILGWHSRGYGFKSPNPVVHLDFEDDLPVRIETRINVAATQ
ncbi:hypothetical protein A2V82_09945, partial [candidate division KSB1 bacterium RBG_16_48_16]